MKTIQVLFYCSLFGLMLSSFGTEKNDKEKQESKVTKPAKAVSTGDKIYTWIDKSGNRIYSDVPREGAEEMEIEKGTDYTPPTATRDYSKMKPKVVSPKNTVIYNHFSIASPANDATVRNSNGAFQVALDIRPMLLTGHTVKLEVDGREIEGSGSSIISLNNINRGTHNLVAYIIDRKGETVATTAAVTVHLHRPIKRN